MLYQTRHGQCVGCSSKNCQCNHHHAYSTIPNLFKSPCFHRTRLNRITELSLPLSLLIISTAAVIPQFDTDLLAQTSVITPCDPNAQTLKKGDLGEIVVTLQNLLVEKGYIDGDYVDGDFGPGTEAAVKQFQTDNGLTAEGIVGPTTWQALCSIAAPPSD